MLIDSLRYPNIHLYRVESLDLGRLDALAPALNLRLHIPKVTRQMTVWLRVGGTAHHMLRNEEEQETLLRSRARAARALHEEVV